MPEITIDIDIEGGSDLNSQIVDALVEKIRHSEEYGFAAAVERARERMIVDALQPLLDEVMDSEFVPTNHYGEPKGEPMTMRELVVKEVEKWCNGRGSFSSDGTNLEKMIKDAIGYSLSNEIKKEVDAAKTQIRNTVRDKAATIIANSVTEWTPKP